MAEQEREQRLTFERGGATYRVRDAVYARHRWRRLPIGDARATHRLFVPPREAHNGLVPVYQFTAGEDRSPAAEALERQLGRAAWAPREFPPTPTHHGGREPNTGGG